MIQVEFEVLVKVPRPSEKLKLVYSAKKKLAVKNMACRRAESKEWNFDRTV